MSEAIFELAAESRSDMGKGASRRLRRLKEVIPAIIYGGKQAPTPVSLDHKKVLQAIEHEAFYSHILTLVVDGKKQRVVLKDLQRHPYKPMVLHIDFQRVKESDVITMKVPVHFLNEEACPGVKAGGVINHHMINVEIRCQAKDLPEYIEVDVAGLEMDQAVHLSELQLPNGVEVVALGHGDESHDTAVVSVHALRAAKVEEAEETAASEGEAKETAAKDSSSEKE